MRSSTEIKSLFNEKVDHALKVYRDNGTTFALAQLGEVIAPLQEAGIDVSIEMQGCGGSNDHKMYSGTTTASGLLKVGRQVFAVTIGVRDNKGTPNLAICLSYYAINLGHPDNRSNNFYPRPDNAEHTASEMSRLQETLIDLAAYDEAVKRCDTIGAFDTTRHDRGPAKHKVLIQPKK